MLRTLVIILIGIGIVGGQLSLAAFARGLAPPWAPLNILAQSVRSPWLYVAGATYIAAILLYLGMLRTSPITATNLPVIGVVVILNVLLAFAPGEGLSVGQIGGALLISIGVLLIQTV